MLIKTRCFLAFLTPINLGYIFVLFRKVTRIFYYAVHFVAENSMFVFFFRYSKVSGHRRGSCAILWSWSARSWGCWSHPTCAPYQGARFSSGALTTSTRRKIRLHRPCPLFLMGAETVVLKNRVYLVSDANNPEQIFLEKEREELQV